MDFLNIGAATTELCLHCSDVVPATVDERAVELEESQVTVPGVLVTICNTCGSMLSVLAQSEWKLKEARLKAAERKLTARLTRPEEDALHVIAATFDVPEALFRSRMFTYYLRLLDRDPVFAAMVATRAHTPLGRGQKPKRFEVRLRSDVLDRGQRAAAAAGLRTRSGLVSGVIAVATDDAFGSAPDSRRHDLEVIAASL